MTGLNPENGDTQGFCLLKHRLAMIRLVGSHTSVWPVWTLRPINLNY